MRESEVEANKESFLSLEVLGRGEEERGEGGNELEVVFVLSIFIKLVLFSSDVKRSVGAGV